MSDPDALRSIFEDPSDLEMDNLAKPIPSSDWNSQFNLSGLLDVSSAPSWHFPWSSAYSYSTYCGFQASVPASNNIAIAPIIQLTHYSSTSTTQRPYHLGRTSMEVGGEHAL